MQLLEVDGQKKRQIVARIVFPLIYFSLLTVIMTWPLVLHMGSSIIGQIGDNIYFAWLIGWFRKALFQLHVSPYFVPFLNYPQGWNLAYTEITPAQLLLALPASLVGGDVFGYNFALLATFVLSGLGVYFWVYRLTKRISAGLIAGTIFAFIPFRLAHFLAGHLNLMGTQWFPFYFWGLWELLQSKKWAWKPVLLAGVSLGLIALTSQYYFYMAVLATGLLLILYLVFYDRRLVFQASFWKRGLASSLVALPLALVAVAPFVSMINQGGMPDRKLSSLYGYSACPIDFVLPSTDHFLWGNWIGSHFLRQGWIEDTLYLGIITILLAIFVFIARNKLREQRRLVFMLSLLGVVFAILAAGPELRFFDCLRVATIPRILQPLLGNPSESTAALRMPDYYLIQYLPLFAKMRAWQRFAILPLFSASILAGLGSAWLLNRMKAAWQKPLAALLILLVLFDFYPGPYTSFVKIEPRPIDQWLAAQPGNGAVALFPAYLEDDQEQTFRTAFQQKPFIGGFFNAFPPQQYQRISPILEGFPNTACLDLLKSLGVQFILVHSVDYQNFDQIRGKIEKLGLKLLTIQDAYYVYGFPEGRQG